MQILSLILLGVVFHTSLAQFSKVPIKSYVFLSNNAWLENITNMYDNDSQSRGMLYTRTSKIVEVEFDLGKNLLIDQFLIRMGWSVYIQDIRFMVGNSFKGEDKLPYICEKTNEYYVFQCQPICRSNDNQRPGIVARRFTMQLFTNSDSWTEVYDIAVYAAPISPSDDISTNRLVLPLNCPNHSWLLSSKSGPIKESVPTSSPIDVIFEGNYVLTGLDVQFDNSPPKSIEVLLTNDQNKSHRLLIRLTDCVISKSLFSCNIEDKTFSTRHLRLLTPGITNISVRGKPVFYPTFEVKVLRDSRDRMRLSCEYSQCDRSIHNDCTHETVKKGQKFKCNNKQLIRMPRGSDKNARLIVNHGVVNPIWKSTKVTVDFANDDNMIVSMPRTHQYFGQYKCACEVDDIMKHLPY